LFLTIAGWGMAIRSTLCLVVPGFADRMLEKNYTKSNRSYQFIGAITASSAEFSPGRVGLKTKPLSSRPRRSILAARAWPKLGYCFWPRDLLGSVIGVRH
jgi:hypothetical protein